MEEEKSVGRRGGRKDRKESGGIVRKVIAERRAELETRVQKMLSERQAVEKATVCDKAVVGAVM